MLEENELIKISGGAINATYLNALSRIITTVLSLGQIVGSTIKRVVSKTTC